MKDRGLSTSLKEAPHEYRYHRQPAADGVDSAQVILGVRQLTGGVKSRVATSVPGSIASTNTHDLGSAPSSRYYDALSLLLHNRLRCSHRALSIHFEVFALLPVGDLGHEARHFGLLDGQQVVDEL